MLRAIEVPDDLYEAIHREATADGLSPADWSARRLLRLSKRMPAVETPSEGTAADLFAGRDGRIHSGGKERLSESCGEKFADGMEEKRRNGTL